MTDKEKDEILEIIDQVEYGEVIIKKEAGKIVVIKEVISRKLSEERRG